MRQGKRFGLSTVQESELSHRWKAGQSLHEIGRAFGKEHSSIRCLVARHGGIVPAVRLRSLLALTLTKRYEISRGIVSGSSIRDIAKRLERVRRRCAGRWHVMVAVLNIEPMKRISKPGTRPRGPNGAFGPFTRSCGRSLRVNCSGLVTGTDFWMAEDPLFRERENARVPRDHLP